MWFQRLFVYPWSCIFLCNTSTLDGKLQLWIFFTFAAFSLTLARIAKILPASQVRKGSLSIQVPMPCSSTLGCRWASWGVPSSSRQRAEQDRRNCRVAFKSVIQTVWPSYECLPPSFLFFSCFSLCLWKPVVPILATPHPLWTWRLVLREADGGAGATFKGQEGVAKPASASGPSQSQPTRWRRAPGRRCFSYLVATGKVNL